MNKPHAIGEETSQPPDRCEPSEWVEAVLSDKRCARSVALFVEAMNAEMDARDAAAQKTPSE